MMDILLTEIRSCSVCKHYLPNDPKPILQASALSKIAIVGQAPGQKVQNSSIPWDDLSGNELRRWLGVTKEQFYNPEIFALVPMGFCYPGKGKSGDLPPRPECAMLWHKALFAQMPGVKLIILIGQFAHSYYLKDLKMETVTETVKNYNSYLPFFLPLVHPSPRNKIWQVKNPWFEITVVNAIQEIVKIHLSNAL